MRRERLIRPTVSNGCCCLELRFFGGAGQRCNRRRAALNNSRHFIEVTCTHFLLVRYEGVAIFRGGEFRLLHFINVVLHTLALGISVCQVKHVEPHAVDPRQGDELELVAHIRQLLLEAGNSFVVEVFLPVERRRAVISQQFARIFRVDGLCKATRQFQIRRGGFTPDQVSIWRIRQATADRLLNARMSTEEAFTVKIPRPCFGR